MLSLYFGHPLIFGQITLLALIYIKEKESIKVYFLNLIY